MSVDLVKVRTLLASVQGFMPGPLLRSDGLAHTHSHNWCCVACGQWTPAHHPEAHQHKEDCEAFRQEEAYFSALKVLPGVALDLHHICGDLANELEQERTHRDQVASKLRDICAFADSK